MVVARVLVSGLLSIHGVRALATSMDSFEFREVARVPYTAARRVTCGDADRDGRPELYTYSFPSPIREVICEFWPDMRYDTTRVDIEQPRALFVADLDRDGKTEVCLTHLDSTGDYLGLFESPDSFALPSRLAWRRRADAMGHCLAWHADLDADSARELVCFVDWPSAIFVYECVGDDSLVFRATMPETLYGAYTDFAVCLDMDRDGRQEVFAGIADTAVAVVFEAVAPGVDSYRVVRTLPLPLGVFARVDGAAAGPDIDRDGRTEAIILAVDRHNNGLLAVYESPCDDSFDMVWHEFLPAGYFNYHYVSVGDVDGDSIPDFSVTDGADVLLYRCTGNDQYERFGQITTWCPEAGLYDLNCDGKAEAIACVQGHQTAIYQYVEVGVAEQERRRLEQVAVEPAVVAGGKEVRVRMEEEGPGAAEVHVLDVAGRTVAVVPLGRTGCAMWQTRGVAPGAYFVRVSSGSLSVTRKVLVVSSQ